MALSRATILKHTKLKTMIEAGALHQTNAMPNINPFAAVAEKLPRHIRVMHFQEPIIIGDGRRSSYLMVGMKIKVVNNRLEDCFDLQPTHVIKSLIANKACTFAQINAECIETGELCSINPLQ